MNSYLQKTKIHLNHLNNSLSRFKIYQILKLRFLTILLSLGFIFGIWLIPYNKIDSYSYTPLKQEQSKDQKSDLDIKPYDLYDQDFKDFNEVSNPDSSSNSKFIFINNKYPISKGYENIIKSTDPENFINYSIEKKCELYFNELYNKTPNWSLDELEIGYPYNGFIFDTKEQFFKDRENDFKQSLEDKDSISDEDLKKLIDEKNLKFKWESQYRQAYKESEDTETYITSQLTNLRVFSQCYLDPKTSPQEQFKIDNMNGNITCDSNEERLFKFLTRKLPIYKRWNNETLQQLPIIENYLNNVEYKTNLTETQLPKNQTKCFTRSLMNSFNGQGIVISAADKHLDELSSLILVLRAINNKLPIQIIHRGDLNSTSQDALINVSRSLDLNLNKINSFKSYIQSNFQHLRELNIETIFPPQEIWFVDTTPAINPNDQRFITYGNKLLTLLFSSFEDTVLIDTDTVPFVDIKEFILDSNVYQQKGAFFFKDRQLYDHITGPEATFFKKLLPTRLDSSFFQIPELTNFTMQNRFFGDMKKHIQESGMVAINKKNHMRSTLTINVLQMWHAVTTRVHGDKELFWLGFSIAGDENYYLNKHGVGAVGQINPNSNRLLGDKDDSRRSKLKSHQLCTTHPAHLSGLDDHTLLWMNSGFITCKRENEASKDITMDLYKNVFDNEEQLKKNYQGPLKISAILVPPPQERVINNDLGEPSSGWDVMFGCGGYLYCAYDNIGGSNDSYYQGTLVEYDDNQQLLYDYLGELWVNYDKVLK
ncbi:Alpha-1,3-mannosyltransferase MNN1 [Wickerhamomyces ciferrii]|uniref:Alpha-1,3-mannosyltransferase MNN1 n=1 Tax=Wickerhamomyces ciferrii (strain ATCC 14091 / BCRC 22168 / CBS 111 / JCM 3599 / NBRC 0793 / NRRL Y-1031 F-60-10) TaxID=1206466 RepID=K0KSP4_WICCF|nr:Alpha-1,3-mannosyltransferase MNN1 [Wickerhamomyces ciferrii]CCH46181.1 Alpha-1,3-mannosyltransferase MNN1 [Wickerhamomyces ciferrii]